MLKLTSSGIHWKAKATGKVISVQGNELRSSEWLRVFQSHQWSLRLKTGATVRFEGFRADDYDRILPSAASLGVPLDKASLSTTGRNVGNIEFEGDQEIVFRQNGQRVFDLSTGTFSAVQLQGTDEMAIEFHHDDTSGRPRRQTLVEIRFHIARGGEEDVNDLISQVRKKATLDTDVSGAAAATLVEVPVLIPRGRYNFAMHKKLLSLERDGQSFDYRILYSNMSEFLLFPHPDGKSAYFVIGLDPPIRSGQTTYPYLVSLLDTDAELDVMLNMSDEALAKAKLENKVSGSTDEVVSRLFEGMTGKRVQTLETTFESHMKLPCIACANKTTNGNLYVLTDCFFFLHKPAMRIPFSDLAYVQFERYDKDDKAVSRSFDMILKKKDQTDVHFNNIRREEFRSLLAFIKNEKLQVKLKKSVDMYARPRQDDVNQALAELDEDDSDESDDGSDSDDEDFDEMPESEDEDEAEGGKTKKRKTDDEGKKKKKSKKDKKDKKDKKSKKDKREREAGDSPDAAESKKAKPDDEASE